MASGVSDLDQSPTITSHSCVSSTINRTSRQSLVFINSQGPAISKDRSTTRQIRSHAIGAALALKRRKDRQRGRIFRSQVVNVDGRLVQVDDNGGEFAPSGYVSKASVDPFDTLSINAERFTRLLHMSSSIRAGEPVFNSNDAIEYQSLHIVFDAGLTDGALTAALGSVMSLAASRGVVSLECMEFSTVAIQNIRRKLSDPDAAATPATIGTILLLLGIDYRIGARENAVAHLQGLQKVLDLCQAKHIVLAEPLRRAIYWQDLFASIFLGTSRIVGCRGFHPREDAPRLHLDSFVYLPEGFQRRSSRLGSVFCSIVSEVAALYNPHADWPRQATDTQGLEKFCNTQADLEGRLHELRSSSSDDMVMSCIIATFLCVYAFWVDVWNSALLPRCLSRQLLHCVQRWQHEEPQRDPELLFWLLTIGKAFAIDAQVRRSLSELAKREQRAVESLSSEVGRAQRILNAFIWSEVFYSSQRGWFWERIIESVM